MTLDAEDGKMLNWSLPLETNDAPPRWATFLGIAEGGTIPRVRVKIDGYNFHHPEGEYVADVKSGFVRGKLLVRNAPVPTMTESDAEIAAQLRKLLNAYPLGTMDWPLDVMKDAADALDRRASSPAPEEVERLREALEKIARTAIVGYSITNQTHEQLIGLVRDYFKEFRKRVDIAKAALSALPSEGRSDEKS